MPGFRRPTHTYVQCVYINYYNNQTTHFCTYHFYQTFLSKEEVKDFYQTFLSKEEVKDFYQIFLSKEEVKDLYQTFL